MKTITAATLLAATLLTSIAAYAEEPPVPAKSYTLSASYFSDYARRLQAEMGQIQAEVNRLSEQYKADQAILAELAKQEDATQPTPSADGSPPKHKK